jgi:hypothetical protein
MRNKKLNAMESYMEEIKQDNSKAKKSKKGEGLWNLNAGKPQIPWLT